MPPASLLHPERSAHATIRGYLYQTCLGVLRWLDLEDDETLIVEGDEDLDRLLRDGTAVCEQVKAYEGRLSVRDRAVRESLRAFAVAYVTLRRADSDRRFVFTTTAEKRPPRRGGLDVAEAWDDPERRDEVVAELQEILKKEDDETVTDALAWLDADDGRWTSFIDAVEMKFDEPKLDEVRGQIEDKLRERGIHPSTHADRLVAELLLASSRPEVNDRRRTSQDLEDLLKRMDKDLARWSATESARHLRAVFDEVADIGRLLHDGTGELRKNRTPGHLLTAAYEFVPFHTKGRRDELDALAKWCEDEQLAGVWLWTGEGGTGKSRLMIEWCRQLRAQGWHAGFLLPGPVAEERLLRGAVPRLIVIDYAETRQAVVCSLLLRIATRSEGPRCRIVLLSRREADWWSVLRKSHRQVDDLIAASEAPRKLGLLQMDPAEAFREAAMAFAEATGRVGVEIEMPDLERGEFDRLLYLHMAALQVVHGERIEVARDALQKTLEHEQRFWMQRIDGFEDTEPQKHLLRKAVPLSVTALTLTRGAADKETAKRLLAAATAGLDLRDDVRASLDDLLLRPLYGDGVRLGGLEPDLLGEELVSSCLGEEPALLDRVLGVADEDGRASALRVLTRLAGRRPEEERWLRRAFERHVEELAEMALTLAVEIGDPVGRVLADFVGGVSGDLAKRLMDRCDRKDYQKSVPLREVACEVTRRRLEVWRQSWPEPDEEQLRELSRVAMHLGNRLSELGRREQALSATREAIEIRRRLTTSRLDAFLPDLAMSLNNLGKMLSDLGRREEALDATREAVEIRRRLAEARPDAFLPYLAQSLNNLGNGLSHLGRREEALDATREAVEIRRRLAASRPDAFLPDLAMSLNNLGNRLSDLGWREEAHDATQEAVEILRQLAASRPDAFLPNLATSLNNLGKMLSDLGRREEALDVTREAVEIRRRLAETRPNAFLPYLAQSLNNLGLWLSHLGWREEALDATREAVEILRRLAASRLDAFLPDLAQSLNNLGLWLSDLGRREQALDATREAVEIRRRLAEARPDAFLPYLAQSLNNLGLRLSDLGRREQALAAAEEAVRALAPFFERLPKAFAEWMRIFVPNYQRLAADVDRPVDAEFLDPILAGLERLGEDG